MDQLWSHEAKERLAAYRRGALQAIPLAEVLPYIQDSIAYLHHRPEYRPYRIKTLD